MKAYKHYLQTGASGFLGRQLYNCLRTEYKVTRIGRINSDIHADIADPFSFTTPSLAFDVILHCAGKAHTIPKNETESQEFFRINFEGTKNLCRALEGLDTLPKSFIFISTVSVYGLEEGIGVREEHPLDGTSPYAKSKIMAEDWLRSWAQTNDVTLSILRLPLVAGPNPIGNLGAMISGIRSGRYLRIKGVSAQKSIVWAADIAQLFPSLETKGGIYHLTDGYHPTFWELEYAITKALKKNSPITISYGFAKFLASLGDIVGNRFPINSTKLSKITSTLVFNDSKARQQLGWSPTKVLDRILDIV